MGDDPRNRSNPAEPAGADGPPVDEQVKDFAGSFDVPLTMLGTSPSGKQRVVTENLPPAVTAALPEANPEPLPAATPPEVSSAPSGFGEGVPNTMMAVEAAGLTKTLPKPAIPAAIGVVVGLALGWIAHSATSGDSAPAPPPPPAVVVAAPAAAPVPPAPPPVATPPPGQRVSAATTVVEGAPKGTVQVRVEAPAGARISINKKPQAKAGKLKPGKHTVEIDHRELGVTYSEVVVLKAGQVAQLKVEMRPRAAP